MSQQNCGLDDALQEPEPQSVGRGRGSITQMEGLLKIVNVAHVLSVNLSKKRRL